MSDTYNTLIKSFATQVGRDIKDVKGTIGALSTLQTEFSQNSASGNVVAALNYIITKFNKVAAEGNTGITEDDSSASAAWSALRSKTELEKVANKIGDLETLTTDDKTNLVSAINELKAKLDEASGINDTAPKEDKSYSSQKTEELISAAKSSAVAEANQHSDNKLAELVGAAPEALNTLAEIAERIEADAPAVTAISNKVPFDQVKVLTEEQIANVWQTINLGSPEEADFLAAYTAAKG